MTRSTYKIKYIFFYILPEKTSKVKKIKSLTLKTGNDVITYVSSECKPQQEEDNTEAHHGK